MRIGAYQFRPRLVPTLVTLLLLPALVGLGFWQLDRAEQKQAILEGRAQGRSLPPVDLNAGRPGYDRIKHRRATARGHYDSAHQFLVDNQTRKGRPGYQVLTPLVLDGGQGAILVDRGWVPAPLDRDQLPAVPAPETARTVHGLIDDGPSVGIRMGRPASDQRWPRRIAYVDYAYMDSVLPYGLRADYLVELSPDEPAGYVREWNVMEFGPKRHLGYAVQWFGLATALLLIFVFVNTKRVR